ncbi:MAG TPA: NUDIX domain-containing protein [Ramlibacter sp.]|nr:NUDIX domain-containing protein [Ramlibacter sp.]
MTPAAPLPAGWLARLQAYADRPPARPRLPLVWQGVPIGSVEPRLVEALHAAAPASRRRLALHEGAAQVLPMGDLSQTLAALALAIRDAGEAHAWRDEQLGVRDADGLLLGTVERAVVRPLGIPTHAVHLLGSTPDGRQWVQQRALDKPNDPGKWDTLMGGMVPATDSLEQALERETWEEAGLRLSQLRGLAHGGRVMSRGPSQDTRTGYVVEAIDWYWCELPEGLEPANQDGEVAQFRRVEPEQLRADLLDGEYTVEAALVFAAAWTMITRPAGATPSAA